MEARTKGVVAVDLGQSLWRGDIQASGRLDIQPSLEPYLVLPPVKVLGCWQTTDSVRNGSEDIN